MVRKIHSQSRVDVCVINYLRAQWTTFLTQEFGSRDCDADPEHLARCPTDSWVDPASDANGGVQRSGGGRERVRQVSLKTSLGQTLSPLFCEADAPEGARAARVVALRIPRRLSPPPLSPLISH